MTSQILIPLLTLSIHLTAVVTLTYRVYRAPDPTSRHFAVLTLISYLLIMIVSVVLLAWCLGLPTPWWSFTIAERAMHGSVLIGYVLVLSLMTDSMVRLADMLRMRVFWITLLLSLPGIPVDFLRRDRFVPVWDPRTFEPSWQYVASHWILGLALLYLGMMIINLFWKQLSRYTDPGLRVRNAVSIVGYGAGVLVSAIAIGNTLVSYLVENPYRLVVAQGVMYGGVPVVFFLTTLGSIPSHSFYRNIARPWLRYRGVQQQQQQELLRYLHAQMIRIVPSVHLQNEQLRDSRLELEIGEAREMIWSWEPRVGPITPVEEAQRLLHLMQVQPILTTGAYTPPPTRDPERAHNLAVARQLRRLCKPS